MSSATIDTTNNIILVKLQIIIDIAAILNEEKILIDLEIIQNDYEMGSIKLISDYYLLSNNYQKSLDLLEFSSFDDSKENNLNEKDSKETIKSTYLETSNKYYTIYQTFIRSNNFVGKIDRYFSILKNTINNKKKSISAESISMVNNKISIYESSNILQTVSNIVYNKCTNCNKEMTVFSNLSEIVCIKCGVAIKLYGTVFEDEQFYYQEGQRSKHGSYDPSKHCKFWIERIQGRESKEIPEKVIETIRKCIKYNNIKNKEDITCKEIRKFLSQTKNSKYNEHVPLIRKIVTGESLSQLNDKEVQLITIYFDKVIRIYEEIKPNEKSNVLYHPYLIYKIIEHIYENKNPIDKRKCRERVFNILSYIHLQSRETLIENDKIWKKICENIDDIVYKPTDRNDQL
jgi:ribosomal protein S27E